MTRFMVVLLTIVLFLAPSATGAGKDAAKEPPKSQVPDCSAGRSEVPPPTPALKLANPGPFDLKCEDMDVREVYRKLATLAGIVVLFDEQVREKKLTFDVPEVSFEQGMIQLGLLTGLYYQVLDDHTIIVIPDNQTKRRQYDELVIRTFFLCWADINEVQQVIQRLINTRFMSASKLLNSITIRDTVDKLSIAGRIIATVDKPIAEIVTNVEMFDAPSAAGLSLEKLRASSGVRSIGQAELRASDGDKATMWIGDRMPIGEKTEEAKTTDGGIKTSTSVQYADVGTKATVQASVHHNKEITLRVRFEVSSVAGTSDRGQPTVRSRTIESEMCLKDGETGFLSAGGTDQGASTGEGALVVAFTPHIVRMPAITEEDLAPLYVGTEENTALKKAP